MKSEMHQRFNNRCTTVGQRSKLLTHASIALQPLFDHLADKDGTSFAVELLGDKGACRSVAAVKPFVEESLF